MHFYEGEEKMITFPLFTELEKHRDEANENFHRNIRPQLVERLKAFGFRNNRCSETGQVIK